MVDVRFELTTNDPWSVDDAIVEGISPLGYCVMVRPWKAGNYLRNRYLVRFLIIRRALRVRDCHEMRRARAPHRQMPSRLWE